MGKAKNYVKEDTVKRIKNLLNKYSHEEMLDSKEFKSLTTHFINAFERKHLDTIVELCCDDKSYDEIRLMLQQNESNSDTEEMDPVEEAVFMISQQKVIEVEPVEVTIGNNDEEERKECYSQIAKIIESRRKSLSIDINGATDKVVNDDRNNDTQGPIVKRFHKMRSAWSKMATDTMCEV